MIGLLFAAAAAISAPASDAVVIRQAQEQTLALEATKKALKERGYVIRRKGQTVTVYKLVPVTDEGGK